MQFFFERPRDSEFVPLETYISIYIYSKRKSLVAYRLVSKRKSEPETVEKGETQNISVPASHSELETLV